MLTIVGLDGKPQWGSPARPAFATRNGMNSVTDKDIEHAIDGCDSPLAQIRTSL